MASPDSLVYRGVLDGHRNWITSISTPPSETKLRTVVTSSRDKSVLLWKLSDDFEDLCANAAANNACGSTSVTGSLGYAKRRLTGHSDAVQDVVMSSDGSFALSGSWDKTLRLWDLTRGETVRKFTGHEKDVYSVAFSSDNRQIVSSGRDKSIKLWNTLAECKYSISDQQHTDWVSAVKFSPSVKQSLIVSCGWDGLVKVWNLQTCKLKTDLIGHKCALRTVTISPDGSLCASGGRDGYAMLWDVNEGKHLYSLEAGCCINHLCFSPCNYWLCAATDTSVKIWDLETKSVLAELCPTTAKRSDTIPWCTCLAWSGDGKVLFVGTTEGKIYIYEVCN